MVTCNETFNVISNSNYSSLLQELTGTRSPLLIIVSVCGSRFGLSLNGSSVSGFGRCCCGRGDGVCDGGKMAGDIERDLFLGGLPVLRQWLKLNHIKNMYIVNAICLTGICCCNLSHCYFFSICFVGHFVPFQDHNFFVLSSQIWIMSVIKIFSVCLMNIIFSSCTFNFFAKLPQNNSIVF